VVHIDDVERLMTWEASRSQAWWGASLDDPGLGGCSNDGLASVGDRKVDVRQPKCCVARARRT
jgi:hypothetical protein